MSSYIVQALAVNDLEQPAFDNLPELGQLKDKLRQNAPAGTDAVFMTGSGSTLVVLGSDKPPAFLATEKAFGELFVSPARLIVREHGQWYSKSKHY